MSRELWLLAERVEKLCTEWGDGDARDERDAIAAELRQESMRLSHPQAASSTQAGDAWPAARRVIRNLERQYPADAEAINTYLSWLQDGIVALSKRVGAWTLVGYQRRWKAECVPKKGGYLERDWGDIPDSLFLKEPDRFEYRQVFTPNDPRLASSTTPASGCDVAAGLERIAGGALGDYDGWEADERFLRDAASMIRNLAGSTTPPVGADGWPSTIVVASGDMCFTADWDGEYFVTRSPIVLAALTAAQEGAQGEGGPHG